MEAVPTRLKGFRFEEGSRLIAKTKKGVDTRWAQLKFGVTVLYLSF